ncbi:MAG TPA: DegV family EDD domain-containing protein [Anaerolineae bacterium]|nr:DegV family EDD domain-containing protein [Anaerolineae bacterium]
MIQIVTDSGCDLWHGDLSPHAPLEVLPIRIVPLYVCFGQEDIAETELSPQLFWQRIEQGSWPTTASPSPGEFAAAFAAVVEAGHQALCLTTTAAYSSSFASAWAAARDFGEQVIVLDSRQLSRGLGYIAVRAAEAAATGAMLSELIALVNDLRERMYMVMVVDQVQAVAQGGRLDRIMPVIARSLQIVSLKPVLTVQDGRVQLLGVARSFRHGVDRIVAELTALAPWEGLTVMHTRRPAVATALTNRLCARGHFDPGQRWLAEIGPALATHVGPGAVGAGILMSSRG